MPILVNLPDGSQASFPDGTTPDVMKAAIQKKFPRTVAPSAAVSGGQAMAGDAVPTARRMQDEKVYAESAPLRGVPVLGGLVELATNPMLKEAVRPVTDAAQAFQSGAMQGMTLGFGDEINAGLETPIRAAADAATGKPVDVGQEFNAGLERQRAAMHEAQNLNPGANLAGEITGGFVGPGKGLGLLKGGKTALGVAGRGLVEGAATGGAYGFGSSEGDVGDRLKSAAVGAATGGALGAAVPALAKKAGDAIEGVMQDRAITKAIAGAPDAAQQAADSRALFKSVDNAGITVNTPKFSQFVSGIVRQAKKDRINPELDPQATGAFKELINALGDVQSNGSSLTVSDVHTLRQIAQAATKSKVGRDAMFAQRIVDGLDNFLTMGNLNLPANRLGQLKGGGGELMRAISLWSKARKTSLLERAMEQAQTYAGGMESGLRNQFGSLLRNKATRGLWDASERRAMLGVINGTLSVRALRGLGMFKGFASAGLGGALGSAMGPWGSAVGTAVGGAAGLAARKFTEKSAMNAAERAAKVVASPSVPNVILPNPFARLSGVPFSLPITDQAQKPHPVLITVNGGRR